MKKFLISIVFLLAWCSVVPAQSIYNWGYPGTKAVPGDYDGDGYGDLAVYDPVLGAWYVFSPEKNSVLAWNFQFGFSAAEPVVRDYDGNGADDLALYDQSTGNWFVYSLKKQQILAWDFNWGWDRSEPAPHDYNGDGSTDLAVYYPEEGVWYIYFDEQEITDQAELWSVYTNAVAWAAEARAPSDMTRTLTAITTDNTELEWRHHPESGVLQVKMASLMTSYVADNFYPEGEAVILPTNATSWVTAVPELKNTMRRYQGTNFVLRAKQLLGLHPDSDNDTVVEFWVDPNNMMRPAPDPEITDYEAQTDFSYTNSPFIGVSEIYVSWFTNEVADKYDPSWPYPWTRAGYTYDWGGSTNNIVGLSEFVVPAEMLNRADGRLVTVDVTLVTNIVYYGR